MIVLVTGSREWPGPDLYDIWRVLDRYFVERCTEPTDTFVVRHGAARGVDSYASEWVHYNRQKLGEEWMHLIDEDPHPVTPEEWRRNPRFAGHSRNLRMINMQPPPDLCLAFSYRASAGTRNCWNAARIAGIETPDMIHWEETHGQDSYLAGRGGVVAAGARAEQPAPPPGDPRGDRLF